MSEPLPVPEGVSTAWQGLEVAPSSWGTGLINVTMRGRLGDRDVIVQRVHPAFAPRVHVDIEAVTSHIAARGLPTPRLVPTDASELCAVDAEGLAWRVLTFVPNSKSLDRFEEAALVGSAAALVGRFHVALADLTHAYVHVRPGIHDIAFRSTGLDLALEAHGAHALRSDVAALAEKLGVFRSLLLPVDVTPGRHAHGDLKASNVLFDDHDEAFCLVDLDTLAAMALPFELGDAIRSWCNPKREDEPGAGIAPGLYEAALDAYHRATRGSMDVSRELELLPRGVLTIATELAMRFLTDALEERYFSFDRARFQTRGHHNLARARGQVELATSIHASLSDLEAVTRRTLL